MHRLTSSPATALTAALAEVLPTWQLTASVRGALVGLLGHDASIDGTLLRVDASTLTHGFAVDEEPFAWNPVFARRTVGLAAVRSLAYGQTHNPVEAVHAEVERAIARAADGRARRGSVGHFLGAASAAVRTAAVVEAVNYATDLWTAIDWSSLPSVPRIGATDDQVVLRSAGLGLRARAELELAPANAGACRLLVLPGAPGPATNVVLGAHALTSALAHRDGVVPARVLGFYPGASRFVQMDVDLGVLRRAALGVAERVGAVSTERREVVRAAA